MTTTWQYSKAFPDTNICMLDNDVLCDVTFRVGESKTEVKCHKFILVSRSPVFYTMFCRSLAETEDAVDVPDIDPSIWASFLR